MATLPTLQIAAASGNVFGYLWKDDAPPGFDGPHWARTLCPRGKALGLDGIFLVDRPGQPGPWRMQHWDADGSATFCSNGTRAALALAGAPGDGLLPVRSNEVEVLLRRDPSGVGLRMPEGAAFGFLAADLDLPGPWVYGWIGNPQLVVEVVDVEAVPLPSFAPPLRHHPALPTGANVNVIEILAPGRARIRSWERGVEGETLCCGTGCAVAGAWLTDRTGVRAWEFLTAGWDPVAVTAEAVEMGRWKELWLSGKVRRIGSVLPDPTLDLI
jgi:diaminopimelate epimerase